MTPPENASHIPIHVWIKTVLLCSLFFWGGYLALELRDRTLESGMRAEAKNHLSEQIFTNCRDGQAPDVMILGSSLTRNALCREGMLDTALRDTQGPSAAYLMVVRNHAVLDDHSAWIPRILSQHPRVLFLEAGMACVDRAGGRRMGSLAISIKTYVRKLLLIVRVFILHPAKALSFISEPISLPEEEMRDMGWVFYSKIAARYGVRSVDDFPEWKAFFKKANQSGITVCLLDLPRSREADAYLPTGFVDRLDRLLAVYDSDLGVRHISFPISLDQKTCYEDAAHFNQEGSRIYCRWFADLLKRQFPGTAR
ncbi:MAG: hypothetical protein V1793_24390 [Pseudomonadota bacterium]